MDTRTLSVFSVINLVIIISAFSFFGAGEDVSNLRNELGNAKDKILQIDQKMDLMNERLDDLVLANHDYSSGDAYRLMSYSDIQSAIVEAIASTEKLDDSRSQDDGEPEKLSSGQQERFDSLSQQLDGYGGGLSFHELVSEMDAQELPDTYRNELLAKLTYKLNNKELTSEQAIGAGR